MANMLITLTEQTLMKANMSETQTQALKLLRQP